MAVDYGKVGRAAKACSEAAVIVRPLSSAYHSKSSSSVFSMNKSICPRRALK